MGRGNSGRMNMGPIKMALERSGRKWKFEKNKFNEEKEREWEDSSYICIAIDSLTFLGMQGGIFVVVYWRLHLLGQYTFKYIHQS